MKNKKCRISFQQLSLYFDGKCADRQGLEQHIGSCPECRAELEGLRVLKASLNNLPKLEVTPAFDLEFNRRLDERLNLRKRYVFDLRAGIESAAAGIRNAVRVPVPAIVSAAASFVVVLAVTLGMHAQAVQSLPYIEFAAGEAKVYQTSSGEWVEPDAGMKLKAGDKIQTQAGAIVNIASKERYNARIKDDSLIVIARLDAGLRSTNTDITLSRGSLLVNTSKKFKGSKMHIDTPFCDAAVVGTAFIVDVYDSSAWLGVLEGTVKVVSKNGEPIDERTKFVSSGQKVTVDNVSYPTLPELFSEKEWQGMQELYQLSSNKEILILIGTDSDRIEALLRPAPVYIPDILKRDIPRAVHEGISSLIEATNAGDEAAVLRYNRQLEEILEQYPDPRYNVEILLFIASHYHYTHDYADAIRVFESLISKYPDSSYASLAQCAIGMIYQNDIKDAARAGTAYNQVLTAYPDSVDAAKAKESLQAIR